MSDANKDSHQEANAMNYAEHDNTYDLFLKLAKYGTLVSVALLVAMAFGFFAAGWFGGVVLFIILCAIGAVML